MKSTLFIMMVSSIFGDIVFSQPTTDELRSTQERRIPIYETMYLVEVALFEESNNYEGYISKGGGSLEVVRQYIRHGVSCKRRSDYGDVSIQQDIRYIGTWDNGDELSPQGGGDVYACAIVVHRQNYSVTNHVVVLYQGREIVLYASRWLYIRIGPTPLRQSEPCMSVFEEEHFNEEHIYVHQPKLNEFDYERPRIDSKHAVINGDMITLNYVDIPLMMLIGLVQSVAGTEIRVGNSHIGSKTVTIAVEQMHWKEVIGQALKEHGMALAKDNATGEYSIIER